MRLLEAVEIVRDEGPADVWLVSGGPKVGTTVLYRPPGCSWALKIVDPSILDAEALATILHHAMELNVIKVVKQSIAAEDFLDVEINPGVGGDPARIAGPPSQDHA